MIRKYVPSLFRLSFYILGFMVSSRDLFSGIVNYDIVTPLFGIVFTLGMVLQFLEVPMFVFADDSLEMCAYRSFAKRFSRTDKAMEKPEDIGSS